jgi:DNA modification methylase
MNASDYLDRCHFGDCRATMRAMIADGVKVQTIVTSPPYWGLRDYGVARQIGMEPTLREFIDALTDVFELCRDLLADDGTAWVNMGDAYAGSWGSQGANTAVSAFRH